MYLKVTFHVLRNHTLILTLHNVSETLLRSLPLLHRLGRPNGEGESPVQEITETFLQEDGQRGQSHQDSHTEEESARS